MAKKSSTRRVHVSPGIYYKETELNYAAESLGITTLGIAGETVKGPAFQPISIENWREFQNYFGGTNPEKFRGSQYPKYELPYIAKSYLEQSKKLEVVRTLGLSGVNAGPAWVITATKYGTSSSECGTYREYEKLEDEEGNYIEKDWSDADEIKTEYASGNVLFSTPKPILSSDVTDDIIAKKPYVIESHVNKASDIMYPNDDLAAEYYVKSLPNDIKYKTDDDGNITTNFSLNELVENTSNDGGWGDAFMYIDFSKQTDGLIAIFYNYYDSNAEENASKLIDIYDVSFQNGVNGQPDDTHYTDTFLILTKSHFEELVGDAQYDSEKDFNMNNFKVYHFNYSNEDTEGNIVYSESGKTYQYGINMNEEIEICEEDKNAPYRNVVIGVLRSRGEHKKAVLVGYSDDECRTPIYTYDGIEYYAKDVTLNPSTALVLGGERCVLGYSTTTGDFTIDATNYGKFNIAVNSIKGCPDCGKNEVITREYSVSLNPTDKNYITKVLGTDPENGDAEIYVEELYDTALEQLIYSGEINAINHELVKYPYVSIVPEHEPVNDIITFDSTNLTLKDLGKRYLYSYNESLINGIKVRVSKDNGATWEEEVGKVGHIYKVISSPDNRKEYFYGEYRNEDGSISDKTEFLGFYNYERDVVENSYVLNNCVKCMSDDMYYVHADMTIADTANEGEVMPITLDFNNYKEEYRYASTPWVVSEVRGSGSNIKLHKLFRFHTISDGNNANTMCKISIENIDPETGYFDVVVRSFDDTDVNIYPLERYGKCSLVPGTDNYIGLKIGTFDEQYESKSAYIAVEVNEDDVTEQSIPCGFLGYPVRNYNGFGVYEVNDDADSVANTMKQPYIKYNTTIDDDIKDKKQYFGMSDLIGIDPDILSYKGVEAYNDDPAGLTPCFHLDARILNGTPISQNESGDWYVEEDGIQQIVNVDGVTGYTWITVNKSEVLDDEIEPRIGTEETMIGTIYENKNYRKFTMCFYGGWDGWDYYRTSRSIGDEFKYGKYKGSINKLSGQGEMFGVLKNPEVLGFESDDKIITSDYYAYLGAIKQLDNPKTVDMNVLATPGIDYVNSKLLVDDVITMIEEERGDALYVVTTPDKPFGASDARSDMYTPEEAVANLVDSDIDTNYACTYYPWEKYYDADNSQYIYLPITRDVVKSIAYTDNIAYPWYASAGWNRGGISGVGPKRKLKQGEMNTLYEGRINYVMPFSKEGDRIWGDKNLQVHDGIMNRISKRRLLLRIKKLLATACIGLIFDPNDNTMAKTFESAVKSVLDPIRNNRGITDYRIEIDDSAEARDRLELPAKIFIKPTQLLEYIDIELIVTPQGVQWD